MKASELREITEKFYLDKEVPIFEYIIEKCKVKAGKGEDYLYYEFEPNTPTEDIKSIKRKLEALGFSIEGRYNVDNSPKSRWFDKKREAKSFYSMCVSW